MEFTPGWAVGWFFVPFANLFKPYQAVREIYLASHPDPDEDEEDGQLPFWSWGARPVPTPLKLWWGTWILMNVIENTGLRQSFRDDAASQVAGTWLGIAGAVIAIPCTLLAIWVILEIQDRQAKRHARPSDPLAVEGGKDGTGG
jgi:hypothetical protein